MKILGLDVCKDSVEAVCLTDDILLQQQIEPRQLYYEANFLKVYASKIGIQQLLELNPDVVIFEPTGINYARIWLETFIRAGVEVRLIGHKQLRTFRESQDLPDKDDQADALAMVLYFWQNRHNYRKFVRVRSATLQAIRDESLRLEHFSRLQNPIINRLHQELAWQFPEMAKASPNARLFWRWLAGQAKSARYDLKLESSCGLGILQESREAASMLVQLQVQELKAEQKLRSLLLFDEFKSYRVAMKPFSFGLRCEAILLAQMYPLSKFMGADGLPEIKVAKGRNSGKKTKRYLSERRFTKLLGATISREESGDVKKRKRSGSQLSRTALWLWIFTRIEVKRNRPKTEVGIAIAKFFDSEKAKGKPIKLIRARVAAFAMKLLWKELIKAFFPKMSL